MNGPPGNGEAQSRAAQVARSGLIDAIKTVEDAFVMLGINSGTVVTDLNNDRFAAPQCGEPNVCTGWAVFDCIVENVNDRLSQDESIHIRK